MMSDEFETYERKYCELSADLSQKTFSDGEQRRSQKVAQIKAGLDEAEALLRKMDIKACSLPANLKATHLAKMREYKADLNNLNSQAKRAASSAFNNQASRDKLLKGGIMPDSVTTLLMTSYGQNQRDGLLVSTQKLDNASNRIGESRNTMLETEAIGVSLLQDLHQQRQSLIHADNTMHEVNDNIDRSGGVVRSMSRRMNRKEWIIGSLASLLVLVIALILYFKLSK